MKILVTEQLPGGAAAVVSRLGAVGHQTTYCHPSGQPSMQCVGTTLGGRCPLAEPDVAVAVDVRSHAGPLTVREFGTLCALRHGTPVVVCGPVPDKRLAPWRDADVRCAPEQVVDACAEAYSPVGATAHRAVTAAAVQAAQQLTGRRELTVSLRRRRGTIDAEVTTDRRLSPQVSEAVRAVVRSALARYTPEWSYADVRFRTA